MYRGLEIILLLMRQCFYSHINHIFNTVSAISVISIVKMSPTSDLGVNRRHIDPKVAGSNPAGFD